MRLRQRAGGEDDIDVGAMRREVAMREGEARRFATWRCNRALLTKSGVLAILNNWMANSQCIKHLSIFLDSPSAFVTTTGEDISGSRICHFKVVAPRYVNTEVL